MIIKYNTYNESIRDKMTSTSLEDIVDKISHMKELELYHLLWKTALYEDEDTLKLYIDNGVDINIKNNRNETIVMDFVRTNDYMVLKMLLKLGANPNIGNDNGYTPLVIATLNDTPSITELILHSDNFNPMKHDQLNVALKFAKDKSEFIEKILKSYKDKHINEGVKDMMTPKSKEEISNSLKDKSPQEIFQIGVHVDDSEMVEYAFQDTFKKNKNIAILYPEQLSIIVGGKNDILKIILKHQPNFIYSIVKTAIADGFTNKIRTLLDLVDSPKQEILDKLLIYCCSFNISDAVIILAGLGANIHINNEEPLMNAVFAGNRMVVQELLKYGADPTVNDNRPIEEAKRRRHYDIVSVMKSYVRKQPLKKRLSKYIPFLRESLRDKMTPKSADDIKMSLLNTSLGDKLELIERHKFDHTQTYNKFFKKYFTEDVLRKDAEKESADTKLNLGYCYDIPWLIELGLSEGGNCASVEGVMRKSCLRGYHKIVKMLLDRGVSADSDSALSCAVEKGHIEIVKMLLEAGANPHEKNNYPFSCSSCSYVQNSLDIFDLLSKYATEDISRYRKSIDIRKAREKANESLRDKMTPKSEEDIKEFTSKMTPQEQLNIGCEQNVLWLVELGLKRGANVHQSKDYCLREAARLGYLDIVYFLLCNRADVHAVRDNALQLATIGGHYDVVRILLAFNADVHAEDDLAIQYAEKYWGQDLINLLNKYKRKGKRMNEGVRDKMTPKSEEDILEQSKKREPWEILEVGVDNGLISLVQYAIDKGVDINEFDSYAFRRSVFNNHINIAKLFIKHGANIHTLDDCLIIGVCEQGLVDMAKLLIKHGANIHIGKDKPMKMAIKNGHTDIVKLLNKYDKTNESVKDMMTPKSEEDIEKSIQKSLNRYPKLGTFNYKKYGLTFMDRNLDDDTFMLEDKNGNKWFMNLEYYAVDEGRIYIYAPPNNLLKVHTHERFYSYKALEDYLDKIYNK